MKSILIAPKFFGFDLEIFEQLCNISDSCLFFSEKPSFDIDILQLALQKLPKFFYSIIFDKYVSNISKFDSNVDLVLLIRGEHWKSRHLKSLRRSYPNAKFILYQWDSLDNLPNFTKQIPYFDKVYTFNPIDAVNLNIKFKPLFFKHSWFIRAKYDNFNYNKKYKISFVGSDYGDRYTFINNFKISNGLLIDDFFCHLYRSKFSFIYNRYFKSGGNLNIKFYDFNPYPLDEDSVFLAFSKSDIVLDINPINQIGLSARTFEALATNRKLITTNRFIVNYDFYDSRNIFIVDRRNMSVPISFFESTYFTPSDEILLKYSSINWLNDFIT